MSQITPKQLNAVLRDADEWKLQRAPLVVADHSYDDEFGTVEQYDVYLDPDSPDLYEVHSMIIIKTEADDHSDYSWLVPPAHLEIKWETEINDCDDARIQWNSVFILSDLELKSYSVNVISRSQIVLNIVYQYHNELH